MSRSQHRPWFLATALAVLFPVILLAAVSQTAAEDVFRSKDHSYRAVTLAQGLDQPWGMAFLPRAQGILITEKSGRIRLYRGRLLPGVVRGGPKSVESGQGGLMDIALHPQFDDNGLVYFTYTGRGIGGVGTELARARFTGRDLKDLEVLFRADPKTRGGRHFGSRLVFDREGYLFMTYGDRGGRHDAQDLGVHQGGIFRFTADGEVPADNPFVNQPGARPEFYSYGHRNAQGAALHPETGVLWAHEHGPQGGDEVNVIRKGANYGWPKITYGEEYGGGKVSEHTALPGMEQPLLYPTIAKVLNNLGLVLLDSNELDEALTIFQRALEIDKQYYDQGHAYFAIRFNNLGRVYHEMGNFQEAKSALENALAIDERVFGPNHPNVATTLANLGRVLIDLDEIDSACSVLDRALSITENTFGPNHVYFANLLAYHGDLFRRREEMHKAKDLYERAIAIYDANYDVEHPRLIQIKDRLRSLKI